MRLRWFLVWMAACLVAALTPLAPALASESMHFLTVSVEVTGAGMQEADKEREWAFTVKLMDQGGNMLNGECPYMGNSTVAGVDQPENGTLTFTGSTSNAFSLKHG